MRKDVLAVLFLAVSVATGCVAAKPVYVKQLTIPYNAPMVASKSAIPFYIVADPNDIPDDVITPAGTVKSFEVHEVRTFVTRDVKRLFENYFSNVTVVENEAKIPATPGAIAKVRIAGISTKADMAVASDGAFAGRVFGVLDWSVGVRPSGAKEFLFTYTAKVIGTESLINVAQAEQMFRSTFEEALSAFTKEWAEKGIPSKLESAPKS